MSIVVTNISKSFGDTPVLKNVNLEVKSGELIALLGPSGSGKTTLLRIIAGMDSPDEGNVILGGEESLARTAAERRVGFVFQHYALFKHMTVFENVAFGLRVRPKKERPKEGEIRRKVMKLLSLVHLEKFHSRYPSQLSGGQRQRVALARALAVEPKLLLLDEPFGALDAKVRKELRLWMRRLHDEIHITSIFVTHDQEEAMEVADKVVVMSNGRIEQIGTPGEVYHTPANGFVYDFLGNYNMFDGWQDTEGKNHLLEYESADSPLTVLPGPKSWKSDFPGLARFLKKVAPNLLSDVPTPQSTPLKIERPKYERRVKLYARPHEMYVTKTPDENEYIRARVIHVNPAGALVKIELERLDGQILTAELPKETVDKLGIVKHNEVFVRPKSTKVFEDKR